MVYYPLSTLMLAGIRDILVITTPHDAHSFERLLGDGSRFGVSITFAQQPSPDGLAQAFTIGAGFIGTDKVALVLGDNLLYGPGVGTQLRCFADVDGGAIFAYWVAEPSAYGVVEFDASGAVVSLEEKPNSPKEQLRGAGAVLLRQRRRGDRAGPYPECAWRVRDHRCQPRVPAAGPIAGAGAATWDRMAGHRDFRPDDRRRRLRAHDGTTDRFEDRGARGNRLAAGLSHAMTNCVYVPRRWSSPATANYLLDLLERGH